jgi:hypothetical protein
VTASATVDRIAWLARVAHLLDVPAIVLEEGPERNGATDDRIRRRLAPGTPTVQRTAFGLAANPDVVADLAATGRRTVVVTGFETDVCVAQTGVALVDLGYRVVVPDDTAYSSDDTEHRRGLERLRSGGAEANSCKGLTLEWLEHVSRAREVMARARRDFDELPWRG